MGKATLSFKAAALVAGFGLGILSYPVQCGAVDRPRYRKKASTMRCSAR